jgi:hypothetical protein
VPRSEQLMVDPSSKAALAWPHESLSESLSAERLARDALRAQIARLEHELSGLVASGFPHVSPTSGVVGATASSLLSASAQRASHGGPHLPTLGELERTRDRLVTRVGETRRFAQARAEFEHGSRMLLEAMQLEPGRYKFARLPVADLGEGGCGVWEVRPRLSLIGMLAGWWHVKLSSGCPLAKGRAPARPAPKEAARPV